MMLLMQLRLVVCCPIPRLWVNRRTTEAHGGRAATAARAAPSYRASGFVSWPTLRRRQAKVGLAVEKRVIAQILTVLLDQVEGVADRGARGLPGV
jgi:hypothetical protein